MKKQQKKTFIEAHRREFSVGVMIIFIFFIGFIVAGTITTTLNEPTTNYTSTVIGLNCSGSTDASSLMNISLWTDFGGVWSLNETYNVPLNMFIYDSFDSSLNDSLWSNNTVGGYVTETNYYIWVYSGGGAGESASLWTDDLPALNTVKNIRIVTKAQTTGDALDKINITFGGDVLSTQIGVGTYDINYSSNNNYSWAKNGILQGYITPSNNILNLSVYESAGGGNHAQINLTSINYSLVGNTEASHEFNFTPTNITIWNCNICDEDGDCLFATANKTSPKVLELSNSYSSTTTSGATERFILDVEVNPIYLLTTAYLWYNGTKNIASLNNTGDFYTADESIVVGSVSTATNITATWELNFNDSSQENSSDFNQTINEIAIDDCSVYTEILYNFTMVDEKTQVEINETLQNSTININLQLYAVGTSTLIANYNTSFNETNPAAICLDNNLSGGEQYTIDAQIEYKADAYSIEYYHIQQGTIAHADFNTNITLYNLDNTSAQAFVITYKDSSFLPVSGALIQIQRNYVGEGVYKTVEIPKTDFNGETIANLELNDILYTFIVVKDGVVLGTFEDRRAVCENLVLDNCEINLNSFSSTIDVTDFSTISDFVFTLNYDETAQKISSVFSIPSGTPATIYLNVSKTDALGTSLCNQTLTTASGTLTCPITSSFGNSTVIAKLYKDGVYLGGGMIFTGQEPEDIYGASLVFIALFIMVTLIGASITDNPVFTTIFLLLGVILLFALNIVDNNGFIGATSTILWLIIAVILVLIKISKRN